MRTAGEEIRFKAWTVAVEAWCAEYGAVQCREENGRVALVNLYLAIKGNLVSNTHSFTYSLTHYYSLTYSLILLLN